MSDLNAIVNDSTDDVSLEEPEEATSGEDDCECDLCECCFVLMLHWYKKDDQKEYKALVNCELSKSDAKYDVYLKQSVHVNLLFVPASYVANIGGDYLRNADKFTITPTRNVIDMLSEIMNQSVAMGRINQNSLAYKHGFRVIFFIFYPSLSDFVAFIPTEQSKFKFSLMAFINYLKNLHGEDAIKDLQEFYNALYT